MHVYICVYIMYSSLIPILMPFFWVLLGLSLSREQERTLHSRCSLTSARQKESSFPLTTGSILVNKALSVASGITSRTYSWSTRTPKLQIYCVVSQLTTHNDGWDYPNQTGFCFCPRWTWCSCQPVSSASSLENPSECFPYLWHHQAFPPLWCHPWNSWGCTSSHCLTHLRMC